MKSPFPRHAFAGMVFHLKKRGSDQCDRIIASVSLTFVMMKYGAGGEFFKKCVDFF